MRMPTKRHNHNMIRWMQRTWTLLKRKQKIENFSNPPDMPAGIKIYDAVEFVKPPNEKPVFPEPYAKSPVYFSDKRNPDWNVRILHYTKDTCIIEGYRQSLALFNTVMYKGLCKPTRDLLGRFQLENADGYLQRKVISEYFWDSTQERLPVRTDPEQPRRILKRDYGVPLRRKILGLENHIWSLCSVAAGKLSCQRTKLLTPYAKVFFEREGQRVLSEVVSDAVVLGTQPLPAIDPNPVSTVDQQIESIYPLSPLVDLQSINIYKEGTTYCVGASSPKRFCHLLLLGDWYEKDWQEKQILARGIAACFTFAASQALTHFGESVKKLPEPVSVNCILFQEQKLTFLSYQLNTLDLDCTDGVKNQVWVDGPNTLFESYNEAEGLVGYNPTVFPKALALSLNGLNF